MTLRAPHRGRNLLLLGGTAAALFAGALQAQTPAVSSPKPGPAVVEPAAKTTEGAGAPSEKSQVSYALGVSMGEQLHSGGVPADAVSAQRLAQGVHDGILGKAKLEDADKERIQKLLRTSFDALGEANHRAAAKFLAENAKKAGVITTASGLQYKVLTPGSGDSPKINDEVSVNYRGTLLNGTEFDSSYKRNQPANFVVGRVIPGWNEALQLMKPGAKYQLFIPPQLAYDLRSPPVIPPGSLLIFDVELLSAKAPAKPAAPATPAPSPPK
jgi:FKBP-type peptidyl-prolyl cis-trans isomerase FkpA